MTSLKTLLQSRWIFILILIISLLNTFFILKNELFKTNYNGNETNISGYIKNINIDGNHVKMIVRAKEDIVVNYYAKKETEIIKIKDNYKIGDYLKAVGTFDRPKTNTVFNLFNYRKYLLSQKIYWIFTCDSIEKLNIKPKLFYLIKRNIINRINKIEKSKAYIKNYIISERSDIDNKIYESYQGNGLNHLLTISGAQLSLFAFLILFIMNKFNNSKIINYIITTIILLFYLLLADSPPSLLRAFMMFVILRINEIFRLKINTLSYLILVFSLLLIDNPYYVYNIGFIFSFTISFYLILFSDLISRYKNYFAKSFMISVIAFLVSTPILINNFFEINLITPLINLIFIPIFLFIIFPLSIIVFIIPALDNLLYLVISFTETLSLKINSINIFVITLKHLSMFGIIIYYIVITYVLISFRNKKHLKFIYFLIVLLVHFFSPNFNKYPVITFIDVGQGDSTLIELPKNKGNILIDTGGTFAYNKENWSKKKKEYSLARFKIIPYLKSRGIRKLDYLILTHGDYDHIGCAKVIINNYKVSNIILNSGNNNDLEKDLINLLDTKKMFYSFYNQNKLKVNNYQFYFLNKKNIKDENEDSLIIYTNLNSWNILLMGDAGVSSEKYVITTYKLPKMDILKVGHHGSKTSSSNKFIKTIRPTYAVISASLNNRFNHPHPEVIDTLNNYNVKYYLTSQSGSIKFILKDQIIVKTYVQGYANRFSV